MERWHAPGPGQRLLELGGEPEQRRLVAEPADELHPDRKPGPALVEGKADGRLTGRVEHRQERLEL